jgi:hypothetical protein
MPQLVIVPAGIRPDELDLLSDGCVAVGAAVLEVSPDMPSAEVVATLTEAARAALVKALRQ